MKTVNGFTTTAIAVLISTSLWAQENTQPTMPETMPHNAPMDPVMMQNMMRMRQQQMNRGGDMSMMDPVMRQNMMRMRQRHMSQGKHSGMMNPQIMQNMMKMRQQHMKKMDRRLSNIESMLTELLERQKAR